MSSQYRGEVRPRRQSIHHAISLHSATHRPTVVNDPFGAFNSAQFPAFYTRNPIRNQYRRYMRAKMPYTKQART